ncbi:MAG: GNAT family protein [Pseudomonadota bacterium]|nr:GNAT family N-acetyltransferase [Gammaproteobacteria bacterium]MEC8011641.1 GNAT family protein [Pseudomonadota bacterium]HBF06876.1 GNAT family N-acetyltransferase [Gammaproteobacteria bacterium]|tara:strand:+ start:3648 stop:4232 length:585 start_codon:yes stop_codon:yes gene_type:complete
MKFEKIVLEGEHVRLEPLSQQHKDGLCQVITESELWKIFVTTIPHPCEIDAFYDEARCTFDNNEGLAFAIIDKKSGQIAGTTRFYNGVAQHKRVEIGYTFLGTKFQKTPVNTETKLLLLTHAFEVLQTIRVEFVADYFNTVSRNALLRLGAKQDGVIRNHAIMPNGRIRDSVLFSILSNEWQGVKENLNYRLGR